MSNAGDKQLGLRFRKQAIVYHMLNMCWWLQVGLLNKRFAELSKEVEENQVEINM